MKLELKHIVPYLPYGLPCKYVDEDKLYTLDAEITETNQDKRLLQLFHVLENPSSCKIILRPLSDLTKEIEVNGEKFVPLIELSKIAYQKFPTEHNRHKIIDNYIDMGIDYSFHYFIESGIINFDCRRHYNGKKWDYNCYVPNQINLFQKLFEWHFDVVGLIKEGLAIDINTLQS